MINYNYITQISTNIPCGDGALLEKALLIGFEMGRSPFEFQVKVHKFHDKIMKMEFP